MLLVSLFLVMKYLSSIENQTVFEYKESQNENENSLELEEDDLASEIFNTLENQEDNR
jgi:hypothetical protein